MGHDYRTDEQAFTSRSVGSEIMAKQIEDMSPEDRTILFGFLIDSNQHILAAEELTPTFFTPEAKRQLRERLIGVFEPGYSYSASGERALVKSKDQTPPSPEQSWKVKLTGELYDQHEDEIINYIIQHLQGGRSDDNSRRESTLSGEIPYQVWGVLRSVSLPEVLNMALPQKLSHSLQEYFAPQNQYQTRLIANTSLGPYFVSSTPEDRRMVMYRLCLGENGFFEDKNFPDQGKKAIDTFIDIATGQRGQDATSIWSEKDLSVIGQVVTTTIENSSPDRRAEVFSRVINNLIAGGGQYSKEQVIKIVLSSFGVVGTKIAQMDQLIPKELQESLASLKEDAEPVPKTALATIEQQHIRVLVQ